MNKILLWLSWTGNLINVMCLINFDFIDFCYREEEDKIFHNSYRQSWSTLGHVGNDVMGWEQALTRIKK